MAGVLGRRGSERQAGEGAEQRSPAVQPFASLEQIMLTGLPPWVREPVSHSGSVTSQASRGPQSRAALEKVLAVSPGQGGAAPGWRLRVGHHHP